jgi:hypothetical protein
MYICMYVYIYVYMYVCVYIYIYMHMCMHIYICRGQRTTLAVAPKVLSTFRQMLNLNLI